jgi:uncharacterized membrane protein (UPF0136 family)
VAAFSGEHVAERAQRRRLAIEHALATSAELLRADALKAMAARTSDPRPLSASSGPPPKADAVRGQTMSPALVSEPPAGGGSYATLGSTALNASHTLNDAPVTRHMPTVLAFLFGFTVVMGASITVLHPRRLIGGSHASAAGRPKSASAASPSSDPARLSATGTASSPPPASALPAIERPQTTPSSQWVVPERRAK